MKKEKKILKSQLSVLKGAAKFWFRVNKRKVKNLIISTFCSLKREDRISQTVLNLLNGSGLLWERY